MSETKNQTSLTKKQTQWGKDYYVQKQVEKNLIDINAIELDQKGSAKLDEAGKPIFKDVIQWNGSNSQIMAIWEAIKALLEENIATKGNVILPEDVDATHKLMMLIAEQWKAGEHREYTCELPVNYMVALCHVLNASAQLTPIAKDKEYKEAVQKLAEAFAVEVEGYRRKKKEEAKNKMEHTPDEVLERGLTVKGKGYF